MRSSVLVLGGGFAGVEAAIQAAKQGHAVTLVSDRPYLFLYPTSIWVPTGEGRFEDSCLDLAKVADANGFRLRVAAVERIQAATRQVWVAGEVLTADHLIVAIGGARLKPQGIEHTFTLGGDPHAVERFRDALEALLAKGSGRIAMGFGGNPKDTSAVRGGPVFEMMFNVDTMLRRRGLRSKFALTFFAPMESPGARMGDKAVAAMGQMFDRLQIGTRYGKKIQRFESTGVVFEDASTLDADLVLFLPAGAGHPVLAASDLPRNDAGFVTIDAHCAVPGMAGVWAVGDSAALEGPAWRAKQGHLAEVMARVAVENIDAVEHDGTGPNYLDHLSILCLMDMGNGAAWVYRDDHVQRMVPLPVVGHWMKKGWGAYFKASKLDQVPRIPGM
ncbi:MAG: NAD(P)/FAD-dependent oxidoreductase [Myxococcota bacterium]